MSRLASNSDWLKCSFGELILKFVAQKIQEKKKELLRILRSVDQLYFFLLIKFLFVLQFKTVFTKLRICFCNSPKTKDAVSIDFNAFLLNKIVLRFFSFLMQKTLGLYLDKKINMYHNPIASESYLVAH